MPHLLEKSRNQRRHSLAQFRVTSGRFVINTVLGGAATPISLIENCRPRRKNSFARNNSW
jgi:hypothetical protein